MIITNIKTTLLSVPFEETPKIGFVGMKKAPKIGIYRHTDIDDNLISIHHFLKIYKFGFSRSYDNLSL